MGVGHPVQPKNFKANILCQTHNSALSPADDAALKIASFLRRIALEYDAGAGEWGAAKEVTISGDDMQRWVLKLFLNHAVTGHFSDVQQHHDVSFPPEAIDLLLDRAAWPSTWGLTLPGDPNNKDVRYTRGPRADRAVVLNGPWKWESITAYQALRRLTADGFEILRCVTIHGTGVSSDGSPTFDHVHGPKVCWICRRCSRPLAGTHARTRRAGRR